MATPYGASENNPDHTGKHSDDYGGLTGTAELPAKKCLVLALSYGSEKQASEAHFTILSSFDY